MALDFDTEFMTRALALAGQGRGWTHPNPMVGAVVLDKNGAVVGEGFHAQYGGPHAEVVALDQAGEAARGGTLYVTLEPCNHTGKTPPCSQRVVASGVRRVVIGALDPNPVAQGGQETLLSAGIEVTSGVLTEACQHQNEAFFHRVKHQRPFVVVKQALTLDGRIATQTGQSQWITHEATRAWVHQQRAASCALLSTAQTVMADNAQLTVRGVATPFRPPVRTVLDRRAQMVPDTLALFCNITQTAPVWVITAPQHETHPNILRAQALGAQVFTIPEKDGHLDLNALLDLLHQQRLTQIWVEAGSHLTGSLLKAGLVQKLWLTYGNQLLLDPEALAAFSAGPTPTLGEALHVRLASATVLQNNLLVEAYPFQA